MTRTRTRIRAAMTAVALGASALIVPATQAEAKPPARGPALTAKGPVGWDTYRRLDLMPMLQQGVKNLQFSSFDRTGGNWKDGFDGSFSCLRQATEGCVIAEASGAGEINSIWFTRDWGNVSRTGNIIITLDGKEVVNAPVQDVVDGKLGAPFAPPFVSNADESSGGVYIKVPMTYRTSMRVTTTHNPLFHHVAYRSFADANGVQTFDPSYVPDDVFKSAATWGQQDPKPDVKGVTSAHLLKVPPGGSQVIASSNRGGMLDELKLHLPQIVAPEAREEINDDGRAFTGSSQFRVRINPDNNGVKLTRRLDSGVGGQVGRVLVDGVHVADWPSVTPSAGEWLDLSVDLPASATAGKSSIVVRTEYTSGALDFNEFRYFVDSVTAAGLERTDEVDVGPSAEARASEQAHDYVITDQKWQGDRTYSYPASGATEEVLTSNALLRDLRLRVVADGQVMVDSPVGEFFGSGLSRAEVKALFFAVDEDSEGWFSSWWPMPFAKSMRVELVNNSDVPVTAGTGLATFVRDHSTAWKLRNSELGYFQTQVRRAETTPGSDWRVLDVSGVGKVVGVSQTVRGLMTSGNTREYLEGDERIHVDGSSSPAWHGTGTEDFYEGGWYFREVEEFTTPFVGATMIQFGSDGCTNKCDSMYRVLAADAIPFSSDMRFGIEHGGENMARAEYGTTAFWYGHENRPALWLTDSLDVGMARDEASHRYRGGGEVTDLVSTFEGDHDNIRVADEFRATTGTVSFTMSIDPGNRGVELRRLSDQLEAYQQADVSIDGRPAGTWLQPLGNKDHRWLEDTFQVPPHLTRFKSRITVTLTPKGDKPWTAARYEARSLGKATADRRNPTAVSTVATTEGRPSEVSLTWKPATDDVAVVRYEVAASQQRGFRPDKSTIVGTSPVQGFVHDGLGVAETWYYRVRAVDGTGRAGPWSEPVSGSTGRTLRVEAERLPVTEASMPVEPQGSCCGVTWSGGAQLWLRATEAGQSATLTLEVPRDGTYAVSVGLTQAPDYGRVQLALDGAPLGGPLDGYRAQGVGLTTVDLGTLNLTKGKHTLTITSAGKNDAARGLFIGVDHLDFTLR